MTQKTESPPTKKDNEDLADTLTAISVVAKQLAVKIRENKEEKDEN